MNNERWTVRDDGTTWCNAHQRLVAPPDGCPACTSDPGPPPADIALPPIVFPEGCATDEDAHRMLSCDAERLGRDIALMRHVRRRLYAKPKGGAGGTVITDEVIANLATTFNTLCKLEDARTKKLRAVAELAGAHRRDQRTQQMLEQKLREERAERRAGT